MTSLLLAEVMDKEPSAAWLVATGAIIALITYAAVRWTRWLLVLTVPVAILVFAALTSEIRDQVVGPAIVREAGYSYVASGWLAGSLPLVGCVVGYLMSWRNGTKA